MMDWERFDEKRGVGKYRGYSVEVVRPLSGVVYRGALLAGSSHDTCLETFCILRSQEG